MTCTSFERAAARARMVSRLSSVALASAFLAACGGGGGGDSASPPPAAPPPATVPPPSTPPPSTPPPPANAAPVANAGSAITFALPTDHAALAGSATDDGLPSGSTLTYSWEVVSGPQGPGGTPGVTFTDASAAATNARFIGGPGDYVLNFKASDGELTGTSTLQVTVQPNPNTYPAATAPGVSGWLTATPAEENMDVARLDEARDYSIAAGQTGNEAGYIIRHGRLVYSWGDPTVRYEMKSTTKSMGGLALLLALDEGRIALADNVSSKLPQFGLDPPVDTTPVSDGSLADINVLQLATHTAGFSKSDQPGTLQLLYKPGSTWSYSDQALNWLADLLTQTYSQDLGSLLFSRVYTTLGISADDLIWRNNQYRTATLSVNGVPVPRRELASGIEANVNAMARVGLLMLREGVWADTPLLSNAVVQLARQPQQSIVSATIADPANFPGATTNYGILWWTNATGQMSGVPTDAFWAWGLHETFIIVVPSLDLVVVRAGDRGWHAQSAGFWNADYAVLEPFLTPIVQSVGP